MGLTRWITSRNIKQGFYIVYLILGIGTAGFCAELDGDVVVLDCTNAGAAADLTNKMPTVYLSTKGFDASKFNAMGEISQDDFGSLVRSGLRKSNGPIRFKIRKNDEMDVYIVTTIRLQALEEAIAPAASPLRWLSDPIVFVASHSLRSAGPVTTISQPITLSILRTARFLLKEQQRPTALESGANPKESSLFGVAFTEAEPVSPPPRISPFSPKVYYYYRRKYKLKFEHSTLNLSFEDQNGNQQNVASVITGRPENWFLMAGGPLAAYSLDTGSFGNNPTGLYVGINWTPNDIFDPNLRLLIVNLLDVNTTNPASAIGLVGLGMGFPKMSEFIPLSTLSITETLVYNMNSNDFQLLTMFNYDVTDLLQFLKL
jgi:hypothetical protein